MKSLTFKNKYKTFGLALLLVPIAILMAFAIGEGLTPGFGISGFLLHFAQALPLVVLFYAAWRWPPAAGWTLVVFGMLLSSIYLFGTFQGGLVSMGVTTFLIILLPPIVSGLLLIMSSSKNLFKKGG